VPNEGQIFIGDENITRYPVYKRGAKGDWLLGTGGFDLSENVGGRQYPIGAGVH